MAGNSIGTRNETSLHASIKQWYARPGDRLEVEVDGYIIDIVRGGQLIEIQTGNFHLLKPKLGRLLPEHHLHIVFPIPRERWIKRIDRDGKRLSRRKSPKRGRIEDLFSELVGIVDFLNHDQLNIETLFISEEILWCDDGQGSWRRKRWSITDRRLLEVHESVCFREVTDYVKLIPDSIDLPFTNADLSQALSINRRSSEKMTYCLRKMGILSVVGKRNRFNLYGMVG